MDRILYNGRIYTQSARGYVSALAIRQGRIVALGSDEDMLALATSRTVREDVGGRLVLPGLVDAHVHYEWTSRTFQEVDVFEVPDLVTALERVRARARRSEAGAWLRGYGWAQGLWPDQAFPTAADLDEVAPDNPVFLRAKSGHAAWVNSRALQAFGITAGTPDPEGGEIMRDAHGNPTGILLETAAWIYASQIPEPTLDQQAQMMAEAQRHLLAAGLVGFHDFDNPSCMAALQRLRERDGLHLRVHKNVNRQWLDAALALGIRVNFGDDYLKIGSLKLFADGALGPKTAYMLEPYTGEPDNYGIVVVPKDEMLELASRASANGLPTTVHAIGDRAFRDVCDVFEQVRREEAARGQAPHAMRHRIEHVQVIHPDDRYRLRDLNIIASMQPMHAASDWSVAEAYWGERCAWAYNIRWQLDQGVVCAFGSDSPVEPFNPFLGIQAAVTRQKHGKPAGGWYPELRLTVAEAVYGFTAANAYTAYMEDRCGRLDVGYYADLVVTDRDIFSVPPDEIGGTVVAGTMVEGVWRFGGL